MLEGFQSVALADELPPGQAKVVMVNNREILCEGRVKGFVVACPWHDLAFDVRNGQGTDGGGYCVGSYDVQVEGAEILVGPRRKP